MPVMLADLLAETRQMVDALRDNQERLAALGAGQDFIHKGEQAIESLEAFDFEQERLKARLKGIDAQVEFAERYLAGWETEASKLIKLAHCGQQQGSIEHN